MKRLTVMLNEIATLRDLYPESAFDPVQFGLLCEVAGATGLSLTLSGKNRGIQERDVRLLQEIHKTFLNLHVPIESAAVKQVLTLRPSMVTFVLTDERHPARNLPVGQSDYMEGIAEYLPDLQANNISTALYISPEINLLKALSKLKIDYVELDCSEFTGAADSNEQLVGLDRLQSAALAAGKLGFGVNCLGGIGYPHLPELLRIPHVEDITLGLQLIQRAFIVGIKEAVSEGLQALRTFPQG